MPIWVLIALAIAAAVLVLLALTLAIVRANSTAFQKIGRDEITDDELIDLAHHHALGELYDQEQDPSPIGQSSFPRRRKHGRPKGR